MDSYHDLVSGFARSRVGGWMFLNVFNPLDKWLYRVTKGALNTGFGTDFYDNGVVLCCTGSKSGEPREIPLLCTPLEDEYVLIASAAGQEKNPAWYYNLKAHPTCSLKLTRGREVACVAREATGDERERAWAAANAQYSGYTVYQSRTTRTIPVMILGPRAPG